MEELTPTFRKRNVILSPAFKMKRKHVRFSKLKGFKDNENLETLFKCLSCLVKIFAGPSKIVKTLKILKMLKGRCLAFKILRILRILRILKALKKFETAKAFQLLKAFKQKLAF